MKKIWMVITLMLCVHGLSGCAPKDERNAPVGESVAETNAAETEDTVTAVPETGEAAPAVASETEENMTETAGADTETALAAVSEDEAHASVAPGEEHELAVAAEAEDNMLEPPAEDPADTDALTDTLSIDARYFEILGLSYADLSAAYGEAKIYGNMEFGLYANFDTAGFYCLFDSSIFERYYDSLDGWLLDADEFMLGEEYADRFYIGSRYAPSDFLVTNATVYGGEVGAFLGCEAPVMLSVIDEYWGRESKEIVPDEMYGAYTSEVYPYGAYDLSFEVTPVDGDYQVDLVSFWRADAE